MRMISVSTGRPLPCCWTDCERLGDTRYQAVVREPERNLIYLFCTDGHLHYWVNSHKDMGNLAMGDKSLSRYVQGIDLGRTE